MRPRYRGWSPAPPTTTCPPSLTNIVAVASVSSAYYPTHIAVIYSVTGQFQFTLSHHNTHNISINSQTDTCNSVFPRLKYQSNIDDLSTMVNIIIIIMFSVQRKEYLQMFEQMLMRQVARVMMIQRNSLPTPMMPPILVRRVRGEMLSCDLVSSTSRSYLS